jgi:hypothetical protein
MDIDLLLWLLLFLSNNKDVKINFNSINIHY